MVSRFFTPLLLLAAMSACSADALPYSIAVATGAHTPYTTRECQLASEFMQVCEHPSPASKRTLEAVVADRQNEQRETTRTTDREWICTEVLASGTWRLPPGKYAQFSPAWTVEDCGLVTTIEVESRRQSGQLIICSFWLLIVAVMLLVATAVTQLGWHALGRGRP